MPTIKDIAREANVSAGTVSKVLNNNPTVKAENYKKVMSAIRKLNYRPNLVARALKTKVSKSIGLIIPDITNPYYPELARGVEDIAKREGLTVFLCNTDRKASKESEYLDALINKNVDGIIIVKPQTNLKELCRLKTYCEIVVADVEEEFKEHFDVVNVNDTLGVKRVMDLFFQYGHDKIAFISGLMESESSKARYKAYVNSLEERGIKLDKRFVKQGDYSWDSGYKATMELLDSEIMPTAIFASNDIMALGAIKAIREKKIEIPREISIVGFDDIDMASYSSPQLTTVRQLKYEIGAACVESLVRRIKDQEYSYNCTIFDPEVILRESVSYSNK